MFAGLLAVAGGAALAFESSPGQMGRQAPLEARCAADLPLPVANPKEGHFLEAFHKWLRDRGCEIQAVEVRPSTKVPPLFCLILDTTVTI